MTTFEQVMDRIERACSAGWIFEDSGLTPGIPRIGVRDPSGNIAGIAPSAGRPGMYEETMQQLDQLGVPK